MIQYLSKLTLNPRSRAACRDLANDYELHRTLARAFADVADGGAGTVRFRVEPRERDAPPTVLVQSDQRPAWDRLPADFLLEQAEFKEMRPPDVAAGDRLRFRLRANPTKRLGARSVGADGKPVDPRWVRRRIGLRSEADQLAWLHRKATQCGFRVVACTVIDEAERVSFRKRQEVTHVAVRFDGVLEVADAASFARCLRDGIGAAKGFGFGLLSVAHIRE